MSAIKYALFTAALAAGIVLMLVVSVIEYADHHDTCVLCGATAPDGMVWIDGICGSCRYIE